MSNIKEGINLIKQKYITRSEHYDDEYYSKYREDTKDEFEINEELEEYLKGQQIQYKIKEVSGERSCSYDSDYLFIAWLDNNKLETDFILLESM